MPAYVQRVVSSQHSLQQSIFIHVSNFLLRGLIIKLAYFEVQEKKKKMHLPAFTGVIPPTMFGLDVGENQAREKRCTAKTSCLLSPLQMTKLTGCI